MSKDLIVRHQGRIYLCFGQFSLLIGNTTCFLAKISGFNLECLKTDKIRSEQMRALWNKLLHLISVSGQ